MKNHLLLLSSFLTVFYSCSSTKSNIRTTALSDTSWELEYIGSNIAFEILYPDTKPQITFNKLTNEVSGNSGCNGYSAKCTLKDTSISISDPTTSTMMYCPSEGEQTFRQSASRINNYHIDKQNKLIFYTGKTSVMRFKKVTK